MSQMVHQFSQIPSAHIRRSSFNRTSTLKTAFNSGVLVPFYLDEVLPGDTFNLKTSMVIRLSSPLGTPIMDNIHVDTFYFFVPNRLVWDNWEKMNGEQKNPGDSTDYLVPVIDDSESGFGVGTLGDYFGIPINTPGLSPNALPFRAYNLIYNEWFRDENLINSRDVPTGDGPDDMSKYAIWRRCKRHDYFTSALPWPQKGPGVELPLGTTAPVSLSGDIPVRTGSVWESSALGATDITSLRIGTSGNYGLYAAHETYPSVLGVLADHSNGGVAAIPAGLSTINAQGPQGIAPYNLHANISGGSGVCDLSSATAVTINSLRQAFQIQALYECDARGGTRYTEILRAHFAVVSPDARLQRPEYLGGSSDLLNITQTVQTSATDSVTPQGNLAAYGYMAKGDQRGFVKSFVEHGWVIGLVNVWADLTYQQGLPREFSRRRRFDYYWPALSNLGEQAILNKEIFAQDGTDETLAAKNEEVFGYQERYAEYRYKPSQITGLLRSTASNSLDVWHLAQKFDNLPKLNQQFIMEYPPIARALAVQDQPEFIMDVFRDLSCVRPMPLFGVPGIGSHF